MTLLYFLAGVIFIAYITPFLESLSNYILTYIEAKKAIQTAKIYQIKQAIENGTTDSPAAIGFVYTEEEEEE